MSKLTIALLLAVVAAQVHCELPSPLGAVVLLC